MQYQSPLGVFVEDKRGPIVCKLESSHGPGPFVRGVIVTILRTRQWEGLSARLQRVDRHDCQSSGRRRTSQKGLSTNYCCHLN